MEILLPHLSVKLQHMCFIVVQGFERDAGEIETCMMYYYWQTLLVWALHLTTPLPFARRLWEQNNLCMLEVCLDF